MTTSANQHSPIIRQTDNWLAINKAPGINIHCQDGEPGVVAQLSEQLDCPLWPVHRLDKVTSGILLLAKNAETAAFLSQQFAEKQVKKLYLARSHGKPKKKQGWVKGDMSKSRNGSWKLLRSHNNPAITRFSSQYDEQHQWRLFFLAPYTGKTHQLRVALKSLATPIDGDQRYGGVAAERTYLHACALQFSCPQQQRLTLWQAPTSGTWGTLEQARLEQLFDELHGH